MQNDEDEEDEEDAVPAPDDDVLEDEDEEEEGEDDEEPDPNANVRLCRLMSNAVFLGFESHVRDLERARERRREALAFKSAVEEGTAAADEASAKQTQDDLDGLGVWREGDKYQGGAFANASIVGCAAHTARCCCPDVNMRTLQKLLARVDARGFERSAQQLEFHVAFMKAAARVIYKGMLCDTCIHEFVKLIMQPLRAQVIGKQIVR